MKPKIEKTSFGSITVAGEQYDHDIIIRLDGAVKKRKKRLSKALYGTAHVISLPEAEYVYEAGAKCIIIGTGQSGMAEISPEAAGFFQERGCAVKLLATPEAIGCWNETQGAAIGLFHVTC